MNETQSKLKSALCDSKVWHYKATSHCELHAGKEVFYTKQLFTTKRHQLQSLELISAVEVHLCLRIQVQKVVNTR